MKATRKAVAQVTEAILELGARRATKYLDPKMVVKATRRHKPDGSAQTEMVLTIGTPNYAERIFIEAAQKAGEPFPVKKVQLKWYKK